MFNRVAQQEARTRLLKILIGGSILPIGLFIYNAEDIFQTMQFGQKFKQRRERLDKENEINRERLIDNYDRLDKLYGITEKEHRKQMKEYGYDSKSSLFQEENKDNQEKNEEDVIKEKNLLNDEDMKVKLVEGKNYSQLQVSNKDETPDPRVAGAKFYFDTRLNTEELNKVENRAQREDIMKILENITEQDGFIEKVETSKKKFRFGDDSAECGGMYDDTWSGMEDIIYHSAQRDKYQKNNMNFDERRYYNDRDYFDNNDSFNNREAYKNRNSYDDENSYNNENSYVNEDSYQERKAYENDNMYENRNNYQSNDFEEDRGSYRDKVYEEHQYYEDNYDSGRKHSIDMLWKEHMEYVRHLEEIGYGAKRESREPEEPEETEPNDNRNALKEKETILNPNIQETVDESTINTENNINTKDENDTKEEPTLAQESTPNIEEPTSNFTYISQKEYKPLIPINKLSRAIDFSNCSNIWQIKQLVETMFLRDLYNLSEEVRAYRLQEVLSVSDIPKFEDSDYVKEKAQIRDNFNEIKEASQNKQLERLKHFQALLTDLDHAEGEEKPSDEVSQLASEFRLLQAELKDFTLSKEFNDYLEVKSRRKLIKLYTTSTKIEDNAVLSKVKDYNDIVSVTNALHNDWSQLDIKQDETTNILSMLNIIRAVSQKLQGYKSDMVLNVDDLSHLDLVNEFLLINDSFVRNKAHELLDTIWAIGIPQKSEIMGRFYALQNRLKYTLFIRNLNLRNYMSYNHNSKTDTDDLAFATMKRVENYLNNENYMEAISELRKNQYVFEQYQGELKDFKTMLKTYLAFKNYTSFLEMTAQAKLDTLQPSPLK